MDTTHAFTTISKIVYAEPSPVDPIEFLPLTDILIIVVVLFGTVGGVIVFRILYRKWKSGIYRRNPSDLLPTQKKNMTDYDKRMLTEKINENRTDNLKKFSAVTENSNFMIFGTIILIALTLLFVIGMILMKFQKY